MHLIYLTFIVLAVLIGFAIILAFKLGSLPGKIARQRAHPQADAINVCGWIGIITLGLAWPVALIWAYVQPRKLPAENANTVTEELSRLDARLDTLTGELQQLKQQRGSYG